MNPKTNKDNQNWNNIDSGLAEKLNKAVERTALKKPSPKIRKPSTTEQPKDIVLNPNLVASDYIQIPGTGIVIAREETYKGLKWRDDDNPQEGVHFKLAENGLFMPEVPTFMTHFTNILDCYKNNKPVFDAQANPISDKDRGELYKYLTSGFNNGCWTWLDFFYKDGKVHSKHRVQNGQLKPQKIEDLEICVNEDCYISFKQLNSQGLPTTKSKTQKYKQGENIKFWHPQDGRVARFLADADRADLSCNGGPQDSCSALGVFGCAEGARAQDLGDYIKLSSGIEIEKQKTCLDLNQDKTHAGLKNQNKRMPTIPEFIEFLKYLRDNPTNENTQVYNEITQVKNPWRGARLDAKFEEKSDGLYIVSNQKAEKLDPDILMQDRIPGISLDEWLNNPTPQGLPKQRISTGDLSYWHPQDGRVAEFNAIAGGAGLGCGGDPQCSYSALGVFAVREAHAP